MDANFGIHALICSGVPYLATIQATILWIEMYDEIAGQP